MGYCPQVEIIHKVGHVGFFLRRVIAAMGHALHMSEKAEPGATARNAIDVGKLGEDIASDHLRAQGWTILERNWRNKFGEIDVIAVDGAALVVVEVKTRASEMFIDPAAAVTPVKLARMRRLTRMFLIDCGRRWSEIRFDVISIQLDPRFPGDLERALIRHHRGVFV